MTSATRQFVWVMRIFTFNYIVVSLLFFFMPEELFYLINVGPKVFKAFLEIPVPSEHFWVVLSTSMTVMLAVASFYSSLYPKTKGFVLIHLISKATSIAGFTYLFLRDKPYFAYLFGAVVDTAVLLTVAGFYLRSLGGKPAPESEDKTAPATT